MPAPPEPDPQEQENLWYSFDKPPEHLKRKPYKRREEDESVTESVLDEVDEGFGCTNRLFGCGWQLITLVPRLVWKVIREIFD